MGKAVLVWALAAASLASVQGQSMGPSFERVLISAGGRPATLWPAARGTRYAVSSMRMQATMAAEHILRQGGNAFDAAVAGQAVLGFVLEGSNGIGGDATLLIYDAKEKKGWSLNAEGTAPKLATIDWYRQHHDGKLPVDDSLLAGTVPGVIDAWYILLSRWGTKSFGEVLAPAIDLAERGFPIPGSRRAYRADHALRKYPTTVKLLGTDRDWKEGEVYRNTDLARTLKRLVEAERQAAGGGREAGLRAARDRFYKGDIAREIAAFSKENGGLFQYEDFASYSAKVEEPVSIEYRGYAVFKNPSATQGPAELFALNILEGYDLKAMGHNSADYIHTSIEAMKLAMADRDTYLGDMDFIQIPYEALLSKRYAEERRKLIEKDKASLEFRPGDAGRYMPDGKSIERPRDLTLSGDGDHEGDTSYIAVVDDERNAVSFTPSLHSGYGTKVAIGSLGFFLNCRGDYFSLVPGHANALEPGKRPRSTLQSTMVLKDGKLFLLAGSPGGDDQCARTMQTFLNIVEFGMNPQRAIEAPRWSTRAFPSSPFPHTMRPGDAQVESRIPQPVRAELVRRGHKLFVQRPLTIGSNAAILVDWESGVLSAGADPRAHAAALAW
ncbi:MAG TPA: gamma-glutamyltransferase [Bryobacteraceae bacterium]|nr:gamma-glutamyltransferase [Bryobacteraceae bacterium]